MLVQSPAAALLTLDMAIKLDGMPLNRRLSTLGCTALTAVLAFTKVRCCSLMLASRSGVSLIIVVCFGAGLCVNARQSFEQTKGSSEAVVFIVLSTLLMSKQ